MISQRRVAGLWSPLAASWLLMGAEMPMVVAAVSRLPHATDQLAALGAVVYPTSLLVEAPIIMLLAASTALVADRRSYRWLARVALGSGAALSVLHALVAFTPLYDVVARDLIGAPPSAVEPGRLGLRLMVPWSLAIAYRRFQQGVLIRADRSRTVSIGTALRLCSNAGVLGFGVLVAQAPGVAVGSAAIATGVCVEAVYAGIAVRGAARALPAADASRAPLSWRGFARFYVPLALTPMLTLAVQPVAAAAMSRMPDALASTAAWSAVYGLVFVLRSFGFAFQEVAVRFAGEPGGPAALRRFALWLSTVGSGVLALLWATPLARHWFADVSGLPPDLAEFAATSLGLAVALPALAVWINYAQGVLVHSGRTRAVTAAVAVYSALALAGLGAGVWAQAWSGLRVALVVLSAAAAAQMAVLAWRSAAVGCLVQVGD